MRGYSRHGTQLVKGGIQCRFSRSFGGVNGPQNTAPNGKGLTHRLGLPQHVSSSHTESKEPPTVRDFRGGPEFPTIRYPTTALSRSKISIMVFSGRPSDACYPCRKGRLRCDRLQPGCTQCSRKDIKCPGYRDLSDFYFRDETANAAFKVQNRKPRRRLPVKARLQTPADAQSTMQNQTVASTLAVRTKAVPVAHQNTGRLMGAITSFRSSAEPPPDVAMVRYRNVSQSIEGLARTYFMADYISSSPFDYLPQLCPHGLNENNAMSAALSATSFAGLSLKLSDAKLMKQARTHYAMALYQTNQALSSAELAVRDSTLAAVLLLGLFEAMVFTGRQSIESWNAHTIGAVELLRLRGTQQLQTPLGRKLFVHASGNIRTSCAHTKTPVPARFLKLYEQARPYLDLGDPILQVAPIIDRVASLRARVAQANDQYKRELVMEALDLDADTVRLGQSVPEGWKFTARLPEESSPMTYKGISLRYPSLEAVRYWNGLRIVRMFLNDLIWNQSSLVLNQGPDLDDDTDYEELQISTSRNMSTLIIEVLASCGEYIEPSEQRFSVTARCLIWPLSVISEVSLTPPDARQFAIDCLSRLSEDCSLPKAIETTGKAQGSQETDWYVSPLLTY
ncbi:C6 zinc finger transcription factor [Colletotrichum truncatum]|uniref:C6 zinc finger transcription factor n=1 Tax=Colletotrichum truncatum TaxID=5467 RepID=A0ACC3Z867_COLTU|nr:C6 zinc finger transcription factor [Colletotrichum truncatum]KAF6783644.1 C6 zinc finger transcription factor [Colletotrichum truncatum]